MVSNNKKEGKNMAYEQTGIYRKKTILSSFKFARRGIIKIFRTQRNFRWQVLLFLIAVIAGFVFNIGIIEWLILLIVSGSVLILEMINTAIEFLVDLVTEEYRVLAGHVKDISAGAVLVSSIIALSIGIIIFVPRILQFIK